jgi:hypothetical protein
MIEINSLNSSSNLLYFKNYLEENFDFKNFITQENNMFIEFENEPTEAQITQIKNFYNSITQIDWLDFQKSNKIEEINQKTSELIYQGYQHLGYEFPLNEQDQTNLIALYSTKDDPVLVYPITVSTKDDLEKITLYTSSDVCSIYYAALASKKGHLESGLLLKNQVRSCTTFNQVENIIDPR